MMARVGLYKLTLAVYMSYHPIAYVTIHVRGSLRMPQTTVLRSWDYARGVAV